MITPVNGHLLIEPMVHEGFIATQREIYEEIGTVVSIADDLTINASFKLKSGDSVYFDSWLAAKFPKDDDSYYWLVKWQDVRAVEHAEPK